MKRSMRAVNTPANWAQHCGVFKAQARENGSLVPLKQARPAGGGGVFWRAGARATVGADLRSPRRAHGTRACLT